MTPQEKADELLTKFNPHTIYWDCYNDEPIEEPHTIHCAIICCNQVLGSMGADRGFEFWSEVRDILIKSLKP